MQKESFRSFIKTFNLIFIENEQFSQNFGIYSCILVYRKQKRENQKLSDS